MVTHDRDLIEQFAHPALGLHPGGAGRTSAARTREFLEKMGTTRRRGAGRREAGSGGDA